MKRAPLLLLVFAALVALPQEASANAGTPLMWAGMTHLATGNALIGSSEGEPLVPWPQVSFHVTAWGRWGNEGEEWTGDTSMDEIGQPFVESGVRCLVSL